MIKKRLRVQWTQDRTGKLQFLVGPLKVNNTKINVLLIFAAGQDNNKCSTGERHKLM